MLTCAMTSPRLSCRGQLAHQKRLCATVAPPGPGGNVGVPPPWVACARLRFAIRWSTWRRRLRDFERLGAETKPWVPTQGFAAIIARRGSPCHRLLAALGHEWIVRLLLQGWRGTEACSKRDRPCACCRSLRRDVVAWAWMEQAWASEDEMS
jgi:hypothetical protein